MCNNCLNFLLVFVKKDIVLTMVYFFLELSWRNQSPSADPYLIFFWKDDLLPSTREYLKMDLGTILSLNIGKSVLPSEMLLSVMEPIVIFVHIQ